MKKSKISEAQVIAALKEHEAGKTATRYLPRAWCPPGYFLQLEEVFGHGYPGSSPVKGAEEENRRLKNMYAELALDNKILKDLLSKKF